MVLVSSFVCAASFGTEDDASKMSFNGLSMTRMPVCICRCGVCGAVWFDPACTVVTGAALGKRLAEL